MTNLPKTCGECGHFADTYKKSFLHEYGVCRKIDYNVCKYKEPHPRCPLRKDLEVGCPDCLNSDSPSGMCDSCAEKRNEQLRQKYRAEGLPTGVMPGDVDDLIRGESDPEMAPLPIQSSRYQRVIKGTVLDVYNVLKAYEVDCPARAHAIKKLLMPGKRGAKSFNQDMREAIQAIERAIELEGE